MNQRGMLVLIAIVGVIAFTGITWWWHDFLYVDRCLDAGGIIESGLCAGARCDVPTFFEGPWQAQAFTLIPPAVLSAGVVVTMWVLWRKGWL